MGTVHDKRTGKPVAGIKVAGAGSPGATYGATPQMETVTDKHGKFRLTGIGKYELYWVAAGGGPYFNSTKHRVKDTAALEPVTVDFELERGVVVKGRLTDKATGRPVMGYVSCLALNDNPNVKNFTELSNLQVIVAPHGRTAPDGSFTSIAIPGPGLLCVQADDADRFIGAEIKNWDGFLLRTAPGGLHPSQFNAVIAINPREDDSKSTTCDVVLEPGRVRTGMVSGPDRKALKGVHVAGLTPIPHFNFAQQPPRSQGLKTARFTVKGLNPRKPRAVVFFHPEKRLGKVEQVAGDKEGPLTVRLEPLGGLTGRMVDARGRPWAGLRVESELTRQITAYKDLPWELLQNLGPTMAVKGMTDKDGKFRLDGLLPGLKYNLIVSEGEIRPGVKLPYYLMDQSVQSGQTRRLGALKSKLTPKTVKE
jgi:hypothetical protein